MTGQDYTVDKCLLSARLTLSCSLLTTHYFPLHLFLRITSILYLSAFHVEAKVEATRP
jgi:hypothetical protein